MKLSTIMFRRIAAVILLAITVQVVFTLGENIYDEEYFTKHYIDIEASRVARLRHSRTKTLCSIWRTGCRIMSTIMRPTTPFAFSI